MLHFHCVVNFEEKDWLPWIWKTHIFLKQLDFMRYMDLKRNMDFDILSKQVCTVAFSTDKNMS